MVKNEIHDIISNARKMGFEFLLETDAKQVLKIWDIPINRTEFALDVDAAVRSAKNIKYPVVLKVVSPDVLSKKDVEGVRLGVGSEIELRHAFESIYSSVHSALPNARILGISVEEHVFCEHEAVVRAWKHEKYGPVIMFGVKGFWTEFLQDFSYRLAPLDENEAQEMIAETKAYTVLKGLGEKQPCDTQPVGSIVKRIGDLVHEIDGIREVLVDPLFLLRGGKAVAVDAKIFLEEHPA